MLSEEWLVEYLEKRLDELRVRQAHAPHLHLDVRAAEISAILKKIQDGSFDVYWSR